MKFLGWLKSLFFKKEVVSKVELAKTQPETHQVNTSNEMPSIEDVLLFVKQLIEVGWQGKSVKYGPYLNEREDRGANRSPFLDAMIKRQGGSLGDAYCVLTQQDFLDAIREKFNVMIDIPEGGSSQSLFKKVNKSYVESKPVPCSIVIYQYLKDTSRGHAGFCLGFDDGNGHFKTFEGNTSSSNSEVVREGEGFYYKVRNTSGTNTMRILGYINITKAMKNYQWIKSSLV